MQKILHSATHSNSLTRVIYFAVHTFYHVCAQETLSFHIQVPSALFRGAQVLFSSLMCVWTNIQHEGSGYNVCLNGWLIDARKGKGGSM